MSLQVDQRFTPRLTVRTSIAVSLKLLIIWRDTITGNINYTPLDFSIATASADRASRQSSFNPFAGTSEILSATVTTTTASIYRGQCYVRFEIVYQGDTTPVMTLRKGYVTSNGGISWPDGQDESATSGRGYISEINATLATFYATITVPSNALYKMIRFVGGVIGDTSGNKYISFQVAQPSQIYTYTAFDPYVDTEVANIFCALGIPYSKLTYITGGATVNDYRIQIPDECYSMSGGYFRLITTATLNFTTSYGTIEQWILD